MNEYITSLQNPKLKLAASLKQKKNRDRHGLFTVEGIRLAEEALDSGWKIVSCICTEEARTKERIGRIIRLLNERGLRVTIVPQPIYDKISDTEHPQGVMLIMAKSKHDVEEVIYTNGVPLILVLDEIQDPGNVGTIIRTGDAAGCTGIFMTKGCADLYSTKTVRASMGSLFHLPVIENVDKEVIFDLLNNRGINLIATAIDEDASIYYFVDFKKPTAIVLGNEGNGVSQTSLKECKEKVFIPLHGKAESLNVAASAAVILYEAIRQRTVSSCHL